MSAPQSPQWLFLRDEHSPLAVSLMHIKGWEIHSEHANLQCSLLLGGVKGKMQMQLFLLVSTQVNRDFLILVAELTSLTLSLTSLCSSILDFILGFTFYENYNFS